MTAANIIIGSEIALASAGVVAGVVYGIGISTSWARWARVVALAFTGLFMGTLASGKYYSHRQASISVEAIKLNPEQAVRRLTDALRVDPGEKNIYFKRGIAYKALNEKDRAYWDFKKAADLSYANPGLDVEIVKLAVDLNRMDEAKSLIQDILKVDPMNYDALNAGGILATREGHWVEAEEYFMSALAVSVDDNERFFAHLNIAIPLEAQRRYDEEVSHLKEAVALRPRSADALAELANAYGQKAHRGDGPTLHLLALDLATRALKIDPDNIPAGMVQAAALFYTGDKQRAAASMRALASKHPDQADLAAIAASMEDASAHNVTLPQGLLGIVAASSAPPKQYQR
jgi:tetratricopeptide (TPR) repeat protein